jgi:hypothetical protein
VRLVDRGEEHGGERVAADRGAGGRLRARFRPPGMLPGPI